MLWGGGQDKLNTPNFLETKTYLLNSQTVSANKFDQNLKEIDGSLTAVSGKELQDLQIYNIKDLGKIIPGFIIRPTDSDVHLYASVRGISSTDYNSPSIVVYVDGIPQDPAFIIQELLDVKRVELLRGPQGTIWGQNAQSGVLNIVTNPITSNIPRFHTNVSVGSLYKISMFSLSAPLIKDYLYIGGNVSYNAFSGNVARENTGELLNTSNALLGNLSIEFAPKDFGFYTLFKYSGNASSTHNGYFILTDPQVTTLKVPKDYVIPYETRNVNSYVLKLGYDFGSSNLSNVTSLQDRDFTEKIKSGNYYETRKTIVDELRFLTQYQNGAYSIFGLYYQMIDALTSSAGSYQYDGLIDSFNKNIRQTIAAYAEGKIPLWYGFEFTLGGRYSFDSSNVNYTNTGSGITGYGTARVQSYRGFFTSHTFMPKVALGHDLNEDIRFYFIYQIGYKPGGYNFYTSNQVDSKPFNPEYSQNFELGTHSVFWDNKISLDASLFYIYTQDKQVYLYQSALRSLRNAGNSDSKGIEIGFKFVPVQPLKIFFGATFGHSKYLSGMDEKIGSLKNNFLSYAPDITTNLNLDWKFLNYMGNEFFLNLSGNYYSKIYSNEANDAWQNPYGLADGAIRLEMKNGLVLQFYIQNIFNQKYYIYNYTQGKGVIGETRNIGLSLSYQL